MDTDDQGAIPVPFIRKWRRWDLNPGRVAAEPVLLGTVSSKATDAMMDWGLQGANTQKTLPVRMG